MIYRISDLFPYPSDMLLTSLKDRMRVAHLLIFFYRSMQNAIEAFLARKYDSFDAQVSENLCQIRAYQLVQIIHDEKNYSANSLPVFSKNLAERITKCEALLTNYIDLSKKRLSAYSKNINCDINLQTFLLEHEIDVDFSNLLYFLVQTYILSKYKLVGEHNISYGIDYDKFCNDLKISSKTYVRRVIHKLQRNLSEYSCQFIFKLLCNLNTLPYYNFILSTLNFKDEVGRHLLPCYEVTKIILQHKAQNNRWAKIIVNRITENEKDKLTFFLKPLPTCNDYILTNNELTEPTTGITTFVGITRYDKKISESKEEYISRFLNVGLYDIILSNMAQHPQYAGILLDDKKHNPYTKIDVNGLPQSYVNYVDDLEKQFLKHKYISRNIGCTPDNASLFLLTHVRCENIAY